MKSASQFSLLILACFCSLLLTMCKKDRNDPIIDVTPAGLYLSGTINYVVTFTIEVAGDYELRSFTITSQIDDGLSIAITEVDQSLSVSTYSTNFQYIPPSATAGKSVIFTFTATDSNDGSTSAVKRLLVAALPVVGPELLTETSGHIMNSKNSQSADAYDLQAGTAQFSSLTDTTVRDIEDYPLSDTTDVLSLSWISPAGGDFVKFNSFDYANATDSSLIDAFNAGAKLNKVDNLASGDIVLTKIGSTTTDEYMVILLTSISDQDSTDQDFYVFSVKK